MLIEGFEQMMDTDSEPFIIQKQHPISFYYHLRERRGIFPFEIADNWD